MRRPGRHVDAVSRLPVHARRQSATAAEEGVRGLSDGEGDVGEHGGGGGGGV